MWESFLDLGYKEWCDSVQRRTTHPPQAVPLPSQGKAYHRQSPIEFSVSLLGDKTRAELRLLIHRKRSPFPHKGRLIISKANRKSNFCYSESLASTAGVEPPPYGTPYAVHQVCNANFQDALHPYSHRKGRLTLRCLHRLVFPIVLVIVSFYIETAGGVLGNIVARVMALEGAPLYLGTVTVSVRSEMYTASASWHMYFSFRLFMIA